ncbi:hypothetical protein D7X25_20150 [bacterium 1XD42-8]|nr:hypothetical protein [Lachnospiraceae bacterium]RKJ48979.1 hypothetical protein D7X25_20150 [bacterium 1XD42-8]
MAITGVNSYNSVYENIYASSKKEEVKKEETKETAYTQKSIETAEKSSKSKSTAEYANGLEKLVPSAEFRIGNGFSTTKTGITLTVSPKLLEKMQNNPETEKEMKELITGVEAKNKLAENWNKMTGSTTVFRHDWIDENGKFHSFSQTKKEDKLNKKLREEAQKNAEKLIKNTKEKATEKKKELEETLQRKKETEKAGEETAKKTEDGSAYSRAEQLINGKMAASKDGTIYLNDTDIRTIIEAVQEEDAGKTTVKDQPQIGANLDLKI